MTVRELIRALQTVSDQDLEVVVEEYSFRQGKYVLARVHDVSTLGQGEAYDKGKWHSADPLIWIRSFE